MIITEKLRQRFAKDIGVPIKIYSEPYFSNMLDLYEEHYSARTKWNQFLALLENFESDQSYFAYYNKVKDDAINFLANNPEMQYFCQQEDMKQFAPKFTGYHSNSVFKCTNVGRHFVSIDMIKGNFTALRHYNPAIVAGKETYEEFIGQFTNNKHLQTSKYCRQVIWGNLNPRRQTTYERYLMEQVLSEIFAQTKIAGDKVAYLGTDEIVLDITDKIVSGQLDTEFAENLNQAIDVSKANGINVRHEYFHLYRIKGTSGYMRKYEFETAHKGVDFKCVEADEMPFVIRAYKGESLKDEDLVFVYNGRLAKLMEAPKIEFTDVWSPEDERKHKGEADGE